MKRTFVAVWLAGSVAVATASSAAVTFDPRSGTGFVSAHDVLLTLGWTNAQLQERASAVTFTYNATDGYTATCSWTTVQGAPGRETRTVTHATNATVNYVLRFDLHKKIDGFMLNGYGPDLSGPVPANGSPCPAPGGAMGTWTIVMPTAHAGNLFVNYLGISVPLP
jgi:hypothetical protein